METKALTTVKATSIDIRQSYSQVFEMSSCEQHLIIKGAAVPAKVWAVNGLGITRTAGKWQVFPMIDGRG